MNYTVRLVSLLRWSVVAMHTALVVSVHCCPALEQASRSERAWTNGAKMLLVLADLPVVILTIPIRALGGFAVGTAPATAILVLLGGLQWYLLASLLARLTFGFQRRVPVASRRFGAVFLAILLLVGGCGVLPWIRHLDRNLHPRVKGSYTQPEQAFSGASTDLLQSVVVPTLDTPVPEGKNVIWCGTFQLAWRRLGEDVLREPPNVQGAEAIASRLNQAQFSEDDVPPDSYLALAGLVKDGIVEEVQSEMARRFQKVVEIDPMEPEHIFAYAYLEANADFTVPFFAGSEALRFLDSAGKETQVTSFGIEEKHEYAYDELREQVEVLYCLRQEWDSEEPEEFVLDLCRFSSPNQILVACIPRKATLQETLDDMESKMQGFAQQPGAEHSRKFGVRDVVMVPDLNWEVRRRFTELEGPEKRLLNAGFSGYHIAKAMQTIRFRLDRSGASLASEAQLPCAPMATHYICNRPFLIVMKQRGAERPFFVMWVDNGELLSQ